VLRLVSRLVSETIKINETIRINAVMAVPFSVSSFREMNGQDQAVQLNLEGAAASILGEADDIENCSL
jgi:hypothetical protein